MTNHIEEMFSSYAQKALPKNPHPAILIECRRAFYSGATALVYCLLNNLPEGDETPDDMQLIDEINNELQQFNEDVQAGRK